MAEPPEYDGTNPAVLGPIAINEEVIIHPIKNTAQTPYLNVRMVSRDDSESSSSDSKECSNWVCVS